MTNQPLNCDKTVKFFGRPGRRRSSDRPIAPLEVDTAATHGVGDPSHHILAITEEAEVLALTVVPPPIGSGLDEFASGVVEESVSHNMYLSFLCTYIIPQNL